MKVIDTCRLIYSDYRRYRSVGGGKKASPLGIIFLTQGFWASCVYRISHHITQVSPIMLRRVLRVLFLFVEKWIEIITSIRIPGECTIGKGLYIGHFGPVIINPDAIIGDYCNLSQGVTIGMVQQGDRKGVPVIGNRVYIGPNSILIGNIHFGDDAVVGAGAVVIESVPDRGVVAGNPARLISVKGSFGLVNYDGMNEDPDRQCSLNLLDVTSSK